MCTATPSSRANRHLVLEVTLVFVEGVVLIDVFHVGHATDRFSPLNDPAGDNYHFYRGYDYDEQRLGILERYKRYNGVEGNSLSPPLLLSKE